MPKDSPRDGKRLRKGLNREALVILIISAIAFTGNMAAWALGPVFKTVDVVYFDFGLLFFLVAFLAAGRLRSHL